MSENKGSVLNNQALTALDYQVWTLDSSDDWVLIYGKSLPFEKERIFLMLAWPKLTIEGCSYSTCYNLLTKSQLFVFKTDETGSILVRASIQTCRQLSRLECDYFVLQIRYLLLNQTFERQWQEHDTWLQGLHSLTSSLDLNELLHNIMHSALAAIPAVGRGFLMLYDPITQKLVPKASVGMGDSIYYFKTLVGEGIGGKVYREGAGYIYNYEEAMEAISDVKPDNLSSLMNASNIVENTPIHAVMAVPVRMNQEKLGVMITHQTKKMRKLSGEDLRRLQGFADQAAIAITNAKHFTEMRETNDYLIKRNQIHEVFTKLSLKGTDLGTVTKTVERMLGRSVLLVDLTKNEWYPINTLVSNEMTQIDFTSDWEHADVRTISCDDKAFYLHPIFNEGVPIGSFVIDLQKPLTPLDTVVLEQGAAVVALMMVNTYSMTDMYYKRSYEYFNELLYFRDPKQLASKAKEFGLSPDKSLFVVVLQLTEKTQNMKLRDVHMRRLIAILHKEMRNLDYLLFGFHDKVTMITHAPNSLEQNRQFQLLRNALDRWKTKNTPLLHGGSGRLYTGLRDVMKSSEEANKSIAYLLNQGIPGIIRYEDIGINRLFLNQQTDEIMQFVQEVLSPIRTPKAKANDLEETLKTYIETSQSASLTAERLHIHPNTLYHRLRKIEEALGVDIKDPSDWLTLQLACHLSETY
jgi:sugar diacid utilization regulator